jgi:16S rRNA C1402 (ribose-2'-O) methylase RsmI
LAVLSPQAHTETVYVCTTPIGFGAHIHARAIRARETADMLH